MHALSFSETLLDFQKEEWIEFGSVLRCTGVRRKINAAIVWQLRLPRSFLITSVVGKEIAELTADGLRSSDSNPHASFLQFINLWGFDSYFSLSAIKNWMILDYALVLLDSMIALSMTSLFSYQLRLLEWCQNRIPHTTFATLGKVLFLLIGRAIWRLDRWCCPLFQKCVPSYALFIVILSVRRILLFVLGWNSKVVFFLAVFFFLMEQWTGFAALFHPY